MYSLSVQKILHSSVTSTQLRSRCYQHRLSLFCISEYRTFVRFQYRIAHFIQDVNIISLHLIIWATVPVPTQVIFASCLSVWIFGCPGISLFSNWNTLEFLRLFESEMSLAFFLAASSWTRFLNLSESSLLSFTFNSSILFPTVLADTTTSPLWRMFEFSVYGFGK